MLIGTMIVMLKWIKNLIVMLKLIKNLIDNNGINLHPSLLMENT